MNIMVVDGQGGGMGRALVLRLKAILPGECVFAVGTNALATAAMLKAGADAGATGENAVVFNARTAQVITGPIGIVVANSLLGELTPAMAQAIGESPAQKVLIPAKRCRTTVVGTGTKTAAEYVEEAVGLIKELVEGRNGGV